MTSDIATPKPGRPRTITRERIADAGIAMGLPRITFVGIASSLGVSHMALYKHVPNLEALKLLVAEEIFARWEMPEPDGDEAEDYLERFSASLRGLVKANPGLANYLTRRRPPSPAMLARIDEHHARFARDYTMPKARARWLLSTIAFHCIALADTIYAADEGDATLFADAADDARFEAEFDLGMRALIIGAMTIKLPRR